ncbi:MAG: phosphoribosylformylglycinamidine synthase [Armatimonadota bacterium]
MALVRVSVTLKPALLDSAGRTVAHALNNLGFPEVAGARIGKLIELEMDNPDDERVRQMCERLLANPVIEEFRYEVLA